MRHASAAPLQHNTTSYVCRWLSSALVDSRVWNSEVPRPTTQGPIWSPSQIDPTACDIGCQIDWTNGAPGLPRGCREEDSWNPNRPPWHRRRGKLSCPAPNPHPMTKTGNYWTVAPSAGAR
eukprot:6504657-Pyramimonas_sp.AAC.1